MSRRDDDGVNAFDSTPFQVEWTASGHVAEDSVYAWLDGALGASDTAAVTRHVAVCAECSEAVAEARGFIAASVRIMNAADMVPKNVVPREDVSRTAARIVALADSARVNDIAERKSDSGGQTVSAQPVMHRSRRWHTRSFAQAAAALLLVAAGSYFITRPDPVAVATNAVEQPRSPATVASAERKPVVETTPTFKLPAETKVVASKPKSSATKARTAVVAAASAQKKETGPLRLPEVKIQAVAPATEQRKLSFSVAVVSPPDALSRRVVSGSVLEQGTNRPLAAVNVFVPGTPLMASTDEQGRFTLRDVPLTAQKLQVRRIGFRAAEIPLDFTQGTSEALSVALEPQQLMLDQVTVASAPQGRPAQNTSSGNSQSTSCFVVNGELAGDQVPLVRRLRLRQEGAGNLSATLTGWPTPDAEIQTTLTVDAKRIIRGTAQLRGERLELELVPVGNVWFSTVRAYRNGSIRSENIRYTRDELAMDCR